ncbi:MAG: hypothetical protein JWQ73_1221, partial [Variovorax sp.]|nr:hypothetical protein [Variovorax sp.]
AILIGAYADRVGRKKALTLSILLMFTGTLMISVVPTYTSIGLLAPAVLVLARMIQGLSAGGEFGSATAFLAEHAPRRRGFFSSFQVASQGLTTLLAAGFGAVLTSTLSVDQMTSWGWRIPFIFGLLIGPVAYYIRRNVDESPEFASIEATTTPLADTFTHHKERLLLAVGIVVLGTVATYLVLFMPTYGVKQLGLPASVVFAATMMVGVIQMLVAPVVGHLSDKYGRVRIMLTAAVLLLLAIYPMFSVLVSRPSFGTLLVVEIILGLLMTAYFAPVPAILSELFPTRTRTTGLSLSYNTAVTIFGGFAPFILTWLISVTNDKLSPSYYMVFAAVISIAALIATRVRLGFK